jgi:hypothetical protein
MSSPSDAIATAVEQSSTIVLLFWNLPPSTDDILQVTCPPGPAAIKEGMAVTHLMISSRVFNEY